MAKLNHTNSQGRQNALVWAHDEAAFFNMLPNGARLKASSVTPALKTAYGFPANTNMVYSGVAVGRLPGARKFTLITPTATTFTSTNLTTTTEAALIGATTIKVADIDGIAAGQSLAVQGAANVTVASVQPLMNQVTLSAGLSAAVPAGNTVQLATAATIPPTNIYLMFTDIEDVLENDEFTIYRHQRAIYQNKLPAWSTMSAQLKAVIQTNYVAFNNLEDI